MASGRKVAVYTTVGDVTYAPGDVVPADVVELIDNPAVWGDDSGDTGYADMKVDELKAEINSRNEGRDPEGAGFISSDGKKADLVAALEADDAAASA
jgi:hypothetical protein